MNDNSSPPRKGRIYLLRFTEALGNANHSAQFYLGYTERPVAERIAQHAAGEGARITAAAAERVFGTPPFELVWTVPGSRVDERILKAYKCHPRLAAKTPRQIRAYLAQKRTQAHTLAGGTR